METKSVFVITFGFISIDNGYGIRECI